MMMYYYILLLLLLYKIIKLLIIEITPVMRCVLLNILKVVVVSKAGTNEFVCLETIGTKVLCELQMLCNF